MAKLFFLSEDVSRWI